jgi:hypothetical protein
LLWSRHIATRSSLAAAARNTFPRQLQRNFESFTAICDQSALPEEVTLLAAHHQRRDKKDTGKWES